MKLLRPARTALLALTALALLSPVATAQTSDKVTRIRLTNIKPSEVVGLLKESVSPTPGLLPEGVISLSPDDVSRELVIVADADGLKRIQQIVRLVDVPNRQIRLRVRVLRVATSERPAGAEEVAATATCEIRNNGTVSLNVLVDSQFLVMELTPHINGDGTLTLSSTMAFTTYVIEGSEGANKISRTSKVTLTRIQRDGMGQVLFGIVGEQVVGVEGDGRFTAKRPNRYLIEITPTVLPGNTRKP